MTSPHPFSTSSHLSIEGPSGTSETSGLKDLGLGGNYGMGPRDSCLGELAFSVFSSYNSVQVSPNDLECQ